LQACVAIWEDDVERQVIKLLGLPFLVFVRRSIKTMLRTLSLLCALAPAHSTVELTPDTFNKEVFESGKSAFIKFLAPW
jgi:hypothetical protein